MKPQIIIGDFWDKIIDHYYDHVHWEEGSPKSINQWIKEKYSGKVDMDNRFIEFDSDAKRNWFVLRWL